MLENSPWPHLRRDLLVQHAVAKAERKALKNYKSLQALLADRTYVDFMDFGLKL